MTSTPELPTPIAQQQFDPMWSAAPDRYEAVGAHYRRCGRSGLDLPMISLGLWHNFGDDHSIGSQREILRTAFDLGITQFDLANNYGVPYGSAEENFGRHMAHDFKPYRDEMIIVSKAGYDMWAGPYGAGGGGRKYILASLDQSLARMGLDYVDIFYSHRFDETTPLEETMGALEQAVRSGKALYAGISSYGPEQTREAVGIARRIGLPLVVHQPRYSMLDRTVEKGLLEVCGELGLGMAVFSPLARASSPRNTSATTASRRARASPSSATSRPRPSPTSGSPACARWTRSRASAGRPSPRWRSPGCSAMSA